MKKQSTKIALLISLFLIILLAGGILLKENFIYMIKYWGALLIIGIISFPMTSLIFNKFDDKGWVFSKILGLAIPALILWNLSYLKILKFTQINCYIIIGIIAIINLIILITKKDKFKDIKQNWTNIAVIEILFLLAFIIWVYIRSFMPFINSETEHFMNYGIINKLMNSDYLPIEDIWLSGNSINYYYFGHYISAFLSKISTVGVQETYNLMLALLAAFLFVLPYSIGKTLGNTWLKHNENKEKMPKFIPTVIAVVAALAVTLSGTTYYLVHRIILNDDAYFYADVYDYIGNEPESQDKGIIAFPAYMNVEGDLHAHHLDTMFALTMLALLLQYMLSNDDETKRNKYLNLNIIIIGILLGIQTMTNYWDLPIYLVIASIVITVKNFIKYKKPKEKVLVTLAQLIEIILLQIIVTFLFSRNLYISATHVYFTNIMSPLNKLAVLWLVPIICVFIEIFAQLFNFFKEKKGSIFQYINRMNLADIYIIILGLCAIGLVILPEIIYLKDIYSDEYKRANTMFKLVFNAVTLFNICMSYILIKYSSKKTPVVSKAFVLILLIIFITTFGYGINAINYGTENFSGEHYDLKSNAEGYIGENLPDDYNAIQWIKQNIDRNSVILELPGDSYTTDSRISVFTANPTVLGWYAHEWVWRAVNYDVPDDVAERWNAIYKLYQSNDKETIEYFINKYNISYIYIGNVEFNELKDIQLDTLLSLGEVVYKQTDDYKLSPVYIIKVK